MTAKGIGMLFREGFLPSPEITLVLEELDISENKMDEEASLLLQVWISKIGKRGSLRVLNLSKCSAVLGLILPALENLSYLEELNISHTTFDLDSAQVLARMISMSQSFKTIDISYCGLAPSCISVILAAVVKNPNLQGCKLKFAGNLLDDGSINLAIGALTPSRCLHTLDLSHLKLGETGILNLFQTLTTNAPTLKKLVFVDFFTGISGHVTGTRIGHALADLVLQIPSLDTLDASLSKHSMFSSAGPSNVLLPFLQRMQRNETLLDLVLTGHRLSDKLAVTVAEMLRCNTTLISLNIDDNRITLTGFQALEYAMHRNRTLQRFIFPTLDVSRCVKSGMAPEKLTVLYTILSNIQLAVNFNQSNGIHDYLKEIDYLPPPRSGAILVHDEQNNPIQSVAPPIPNRASQQPAQPNAYEGYYEKAIGGSQNNDNYSSSSYVTSDNNNNSYNDNSYTNNASYDNSNYDNTNYDNNYDNNNYSFSNSGYDNHQSSAIDPQDWSSYSYQEEQNNQNNSGANNDLFSALASVLENDSGSFENSNNWQ